MCGFGAFAGTGSPSLRDPPKACSQSPGCSMRKRKTSHYPATEPDDGGMACEPGAHPGAV